MSSAFGGPVHVCHGFDISMYKANWVTPNFRLVQL